MQRPCAWAAGSWGEGGQETSGLGDEDLWVHVEGVFITGEHKLTRVDPFSGKRVSGKDGWGKGPAGQ